MRDWASRLVALWRVGWACRHLTTDEVETIGRVVPILASPAYRYARLAVAQTATAAVMRDHHAWHEIARIAKAWGWSDALYRRMAASETTERLLRVSERTCPSRVRELAVELAYHEYVAAHPGERQPSVACPVDLPGASRVVHRTQTAWNSGVQ